MRASTKKHRDVNRRRVGRPTKLNPNVQRKIADVLHLGYSMQTAADYVGLHYSTLYAWVQRGARAKSGPFRDFDVAVFWARFLARIEGWIASAKDGK
jgi:hypothetical protein